MRSDYCNLDVEQEAPLCVSKAFMLKRFTFDSSEFVISSVSEIVRFDLELLRSIANEQSSRTANAISFNRNCLKSA